jgi:hypothetical protein
MNEIIINENEFLIIKIENTKPIDLYDFSNALFALHAQYKRFIAINYKKTDEDVKLYVNELKEGSKIVKLVRFLKLDKLFQEIIIKKFNEHLKNQFDLFLEQKLPNLENPLTKQELIELRTILKHNANDYNSKIHFEAGTGNTITNNFHYTGVQTRAISDEIDKTIINLNTNANNNFQNEILQLCDKNSQKGISVRGIIDTFSDDDFTIICSDELRQKMLNKNTNHPFKVYYIVNGEIKRLQSNGNIIAYIINEIVEIINEKENTEKS